ncbi:unnamed protein product [Aphanomyces euteiches]|uniref:Uncharacterized protein n=1 Tax=Aphanomyces euteiches TaxID=100861 RepID=A0A6G0XVZ8_9STRA|nr:hypothetical protein Ae201684_001153 [Aphanomyces euteiches]KAH9099889.1 hypothetical protein Ae201684P_018897 [Aphanomyces euteiches]KAH9144036.1 hypothetical protein AeRB84_011999 [Aphanomyces euteiches]
MTSYAAWDKYDVETAMKQLEDEEAKKAKVKEMQKFMKKKDVVVEDARDSAEVQATKVAIAALKAKKLAQRQDKVVEVNKQAILLQKKSVNIENAMRARKEGNSRLSKGQLTDAVTYFHQAIEAIETLDDVISQLDAARAEAIPEVPVPHACDNQSDAPCNCDHSKPNEVKKTPAIPKSSDLKGISKMLRVDCLIGIGKCEMERCHYAAASEAFKDAILHDADNMEAWKLRANAFQAMGALLIALLHWNKVVLVEGEKSDSKLELDAIEEELVAETYDDEDVYTKAMQYLARPTPLEILTRIELLRHEADVIMFEGFYVYSTNKYRAIIGTLDFLQKTHSFDVTLLDQLRLACHVNIASGYLETKKNFAKAIDHCKAALALDPTNGAQETLCHQRLLRSLKTLHPAP